MPWRRDWQPTAVFLPGESHGQRGLVGYSPRGCTESDTTERLSGVNAVGAAQTRGFQKTHQGFSRQQKHTLPGGHERVGPLLSKEGRRTAVHKPRSRAITRVLC